VQKCRNTPDLALSEFSPLIIFSHVKGSNAHANLAFLIGPKVASRSTGSMLKIQRATDGAITVLTVSGRLDAENIDELRLSLDILPKGNAVALDLADLLLADREVFCEGFGFSDLRRPGMCS
jgi:hypothetical protein